MALYIEEIHCVVRITGSSRPALHSDEKSEEPAQAFTFAKPMARTESTPEPSQMATEERNEAAGQKIEPTLQDLDPRQVADRVYELMQRELLLSRERSGARRKG